MNYKSQLHMLFLFDLYIYVIMYRLIEQHARLAYDVYATYLKIEFN